jgi:RNA polymerase sigma-70 factor (ECF subfamily)
MNIEREPLATGCAALAFTGDLSQLFGEHHRRVLIAAYRITGSMADAEDVTQSVFLRLAAANEPMANAASYLYRAAINGALDLLRRRKAASTEPLESAAGVTSTRHGSSPEMQASSRELGNILRVAISELSPRAAEMFTLRYLEELGNREIAALMGTSQAVVAVTLHNARSRLKKRLMETQRGKQ